jgi:hypothetical protein
MAAPRSRPHVRAKPEDVAPDDLQRLGSVHGLLTTLNDPLASQGRIEALCKEMPVLAARIVAHAREQAPQRAVTQLRMALGVVGNRGLEVVLLQLLEDLTTLKAELDDS